MPGIGLAIGIPFKKVRGLAQSILDDILGLLLGYLNNPKMGAAISTKELPVSDEEEAFGYGLIEL